MPANSSTGKSLLRDGDQVCSKVWKQGPRPWRCRLAAHFRKKPKACLASISRVEACWPATPTRFDFTFAGVLDSASLQLPATSGLPCLIRQNVPLGSAQPKNKKNGVIFGAIQCDSVRFGHIFSEGATLDSEDFYFFVIGRIRLD
jgi:hypothetical protein